MTNHEHHARQVASIRDVEQALEEYTTVFSRRPGVAGVGIQEEENVLVLMVYLEHKDRDEPTRDSLPTFVHITRADGTQVQVPVSTQVIGAVTLSTGTSSLQTDSRR